MQGLAKNFDFIEENRECIIILKNNFYLAHKHVIMFV